MSEITKEVQQKRISFDLRGDNAEAFEAFRKDLAEKLGFNISPSKTVLWLLQQAKTGGDGE
jgi:hypothetical protein|tara:strand:+ start:1873 stop:2055 length:183 start_codon:yes stop_codon:yes gene_type:complete